MVELRFFAVADADAFSPPATRVGRMTPIGKTRNPDGSLSLDPGPATVVLADEHEPADRAFLRGEVLGDRIKVADEATARALEVRFEADAGGPPAGAIESGSADDPAARPKSKTKSKENDQ